jgi:DNA topoisomerase-6 subunit B
MKEIKLALQEAGRRLATYVHKKKRAELENKKRAYIEKYLPHIGIALKEIINLSESEKENILKILESILEETRESFDVNNQNGEEDGKKE